MFEVHSQGKTRTLGIFGGGQLGLYLCEAAQRLGVRTEVIDPDEQAPAAVAADRFICAPLDDVDAIAGLIDRCDILTFEREHIPEATLEQLQSATDRAEVEVQPDLDTFRTLGDKASQKLWLAACQLPTLPFTLFPANGQSHAVMSGPVTPPLVQKARRGGYDGQGVQRIDAEDQLDRLWPVSSVLEVALEQPLEVAVITVRDTQGQILVYPAVSMTFDERFHAVQAVRSPAAISPTLRRRCESVARQAIAQMHGAGVFAVELFVNQQDEIWINEISPRVHNAGHLTQQAYRHSQFEQHVRAVMGMPLGPVTPRAPAAVMLNLLHDEQQAIELGEQAPHKLWLDPHSNTRLYWYGKSASRAGRKLGHITATSLSAEEALARVESGLRTLANPQLPQAEAS